MTIVRCNCIKCIYNSDRVCTKSEIFLEESDEQWKDCDSTKLRENNDSREYKDK